MRAITKDVTDRERHDTFAALFVDLSGPLDRLNALELINQIKEAVNQARMDIVVNFEHLKLATPDVLKALVDSDPMKVAIPGVRVRLCKFKDAFEASLEGFSFAGLKHLNEDLKNA
jgi:hypothetical protein